MQHITQMQENHLLQITNLLSIYGVLAIKQLEKMYPELESSKLLMLLKKLEKSGRLSILTEQGLVVYTKDYDPDTAVLSALWVLLDFLPEVTYHTPGNFPVTLTFFTANDAYEVIYVPEEKEILINHALSEYQENAPHRLVIVNRTSQIPLLSFPGISAFCTVLPDGEIQYYKKQGVTDI